MREALLRHVLYPVWHWAKKDGFNQAIRDVEASQWLSTSEILALQQQKLVELMRFAGKNVPYYRELLRRHGISVEDIADDGVFRSIPPLTKGAIQNQTDSLISENLQHNKLFANSTSGSTGEALRFYTDARSMPTRAATLLRSDSWTGWRLGERVVRLWGAPMDEKLTTGLRGKLHGWVTGDRFLSCFVLTESRMDEYIGVIRRFRPALMVAYPGPLEQFAFHCRERGVKFDSLKAIVSSAETLWPYQRDIIEQALGVRVYDRYGSREVAHIASECELHSGLHISADRLIVEVVDEDGRPCSPGMTGRILVTDLDNYGMPLIRYEIGDRGALAEHQPCSCGRGLPRLEFVEGRTMDIVHAPDGRRFGGTFWTLMLKRRPGIRQFQITQDRLDGIVINFVADDQFESDVLSYFAKHIQDYCGHEFRVEFNEKNSINVTGSGKRRLILSNLSSEAIGKSSTAPTEG